MKRALCGDHSLIVSALFLKMGRTNTTFHKGLLNFLLLELDRNSLENFKFGLSTHSIYCTSVSATLADSEEKKCKKNELVMLKISAKLALTCFSRRCVKSTFVLNSSRLQSGKGSNDKSFEHAAIHSLKGLVSREKYLLKVYNNK